MKAFIICMGLLIVISIGRLFYIRNDIGKWSFFNPQDTASIQNKSTHFKFEELSILSELVLTENQLGFLKIDNINEENIIPKLGRYFSNCTIEKGIGRQDGPDFNFYKVKQMDVVAFQIHMDGNDSNTVSSIWINHPEITDQFGVKSKCTADSLLFLRPKIQFHFDTHFNVLGSIESSNIEYLMRGDFKSTQNFKFTNINDTIRNEQVRKMVVKNIIWR